MQDSLLLQLYVSTATAADGVPCMAGKAELDLPVACAQHLGQVSCSTTQCMTPLLYSVCTSLSASAEVGHLMEPDSLNPTRQTAYGCYGSSRHTCLLCLLQGWHVAAHHRCIHLRQSLDVGYNCIVMDS